MTGDYNDNGQLQLQRKMQRQQQMQVQMQVLRLRPAQKPRRTSLRDDSF
jgi:hypothetical protein